MKASYFNTIKRTAASSFALVFLFSCGESKKEERDAGISGRYVNESFLQAIPDSVAGLVPAYCYEMNFISRDSVDILYGFEDGQLGYKRAGRDFVLIKALQEKDMKFRLNKNQTITLIDSGWNGNISNSMFKKSITLNGKKWDFETYLNQQMIAGAYTLYKDGKSTGQKITFTPDGSVSGIDGYESYSICYSGDCVGEIYPISNSITFKNASEKMITYAFVKETKLKKISIYDIEPPIKDMKGERAIKEMMYDLRQE